MKSAALLLQAALLSLSGFAFAGPDDHAYQDLVEAHYRQMVLCIETAKDEPEARACTNRTMADCLEQTEVVSRAVESTCANRELNIWRQIYSDTVSNAFTRAQARDQDSLSVGSAEFGAVEKLMSSEALWFTHKTQQCELEMIKWGAGTIVTTALPVCLQKQYASRILFLRGLRL